MQLNDFLNTYQIQTGIKSFDKADLWKQMEMMESLLNT